MGRLVRWLGLPYNWKLCEKLDQLIRHICPDLGEEAITAIWYTVMTVDSLFDLHLFWDEASDLSVVQNNQDFDTPVEDAGATSNNRRCGCLKTEL